MSVVLPPDMDLEPPPPPPPLDEPEEVMVALTKAQVRDLTLETLQALNAKQLQALGGEQLRVLSVGDLLPGQLQALRSEQLQELLSTQLDALSVSQLEAFSITQLNSVALRERLAKDLSIAKLESLNISEGAAVSHRQKVIKSRWQNDLLAKLTLKKDEDLKYVEEQIKQLYAGRRDADRRLGLANQAIRDQEALKGEAERKRAPLILKKAQLKDMIGAAKDYPDDYGDELKEFTEELKKYEEEIKKQDEIIEDLSMELVIRQQKVNKITNEMAILKAKREVYEGAYKNIQSGRPPFAPPEIARDRKKEREVKEKAEGIQLTGETYKKREEILEVMVALELLHGAHYRLRSDGRYDPMIRFKLVKHLFEDRRTERERDFQKIFANNSAFKITEMVKIAKMSDRKKKEEEIKHLEHLFWEIVNRIAEEEQKKGRTSTVFATLSTLLGTEVKYLEGKKEKGVSKQDYSGYAGIFPMLLDKLSGTDTKMLHEWQALLLDPRNSLQVIVQHQQEFNQEQLLAATDIEFQDYLRKPLFSNSSGRILTDVELFDLINKAVGFDLAKCIKSRPAERFSKSPDSIKPDYYHFSSEGERLVIDPSGTDPVKSGLGVGNYPLSPFEILKSEYFKNPAMTSEQFTSGMKEALKKGRLTESTIDHIINSKLKREGKPDALGSSPYSIGAAIRIGKAREEAELKRRTEEARREAEKEAESRGETLVEVAITPEGLATRVREQDQRIRELEAKLERERITRDRALEVEADRKAEQEQKLRLEAQRQMEVERKLREEIEAKVREEETKRRVEMEQKLRAETEQRVRAEVQRQQQSSTETGGPGTGSGSGTGGGGGWQPPTGKGSRRPGGGRR